MPNKIKIEEVIKKLPSFVSIVPDTYKGMRYNAEFIDIEYDEKFVANVASVVTLQHGCKSRSNDLRSKTNQDKFRGKFGKENKIDINEVKLKIPHFLEIDESTYTGVRNKAKFYDNEYKVWFEAMPANMMKGRGYCKQRQYDNNKIRGIIPLEEVQQRLQDAFGDEYSILPDTYKSASEYATFMKKDGATFRCDVYTVLSGKHKYRKELEKWKCKVLVRDNWICQRCGSEDDSQAHHIKPYNSYVEDRFNPDNGITLCKECHNLYHAIYKNDENEENLKHFILQCNVFEI